MKRTIQSVDSEESLHSHIPGNEVVLTLNDAWIRLIKTGELEEFTVKLNNSKTSISCVVGGKKFQTIQVDNHHAALRMLLDMVNQQYPLGYEYEDLFPPSAA